MSYGLPKIIPLLNCFLYVLAIILLWHEQGYTGRIMRLDRKTIWIPTLGEFVFVAVLAWVFVLGRGPVSLLGDGDTGWHIRAGEHILATQSFPKVDLFSFSKAGQEWFAWEWMADVALALAHKTGGLVGVVVLAGVIIAATSTLLFHAMIWRGANLLAAAVVMLVATGASNVHWLARPHLFSYLLLTLSVFWLEADRRRPTRWVFGLAGLSVLWTNLHGGFGALVATVGIYLAGSVAENFWKPAEQRDWSRSKRYAALLTLVAAATLVNPYTYHLHQHILAYLKSDFILNHVAEFQSPSFRAENMRHFELVLFAGLAMAPALIRRRDLTMALLILFWAHASLVSARHILLYVAVAAPVVAQWATELWEQAAASGNRVLGTLQEVVRDYGAGRYGAGKGFRVAWLAPVSVAVMTVVLANGQHRERLRAEFPKDRFPVAACQAHPSVFDGRKVFTSDQWADYLIYNYYPRQKVFFDGRSDFYGAQMGKEYLGMANSRHDWAELFDRHGFEVALLPARWPLSTTIKTHPEWRIRYDDGKALLLERVAGRPAESAAVPRPPRPAPES